MAVRVLQQAAAEHLADLAYLVTRLTADPQATKFTPGVEAAFAGLQAQLEDWNRHRHAVQEVQTGLRDAKETLGNAVRTAQNVILDDRGYDRSSPSFVTYFPHGLVAITRASYADQSAAVRCLARQCAQDVSPIVQDQAGLLQAAADKMDTAFARRSDALVAESASCGRLQVQKLRAIYISRLVGHRMAELYPDEQERVRSYFRPIIRRRRPAGPTAGKPTPETAAVTTAEHL
jgi:hypothetical protein